MAGKGGSASRPWRDRRALTAAWPAVELAAALVRSRRDPAGLPIIHDAERFFARDFDAVLAPGQAVWIKLTG